ncbi:MAG: hypothetical protein F2663_02895 [Actinobacteria bacterium]|uniref:Unannotated protein n=1 Tax=freshwater metagenome TaxID=449393 RepID=A0A6J6NSY2_9ZZZZ|nr:hypothetical protein [Actinomycetota bacterium]
MAVKLHRCSVLWAKFGAHPCWRVQRELDAKGISYEIVTGPLSRKKRTVVSALSGQAAYPVIEFEDGSFYREQSKEMAARIRSGELFGSRAAAPVDEITVMSDADEGVDADGG